MEIVIGATPYVNPQDRNRRARRSDMIEGRVLNVRGPRKPYGMPPPGGPGERRHRSSPPDPGGGRVITVLIPDGYTLPKDAASNKMKVLMRFVPNR